MALSGSIDTRKTLLGTGLRASRNMLIDTHVIFKATLPLIYNHKSYGTPWPTNLSRMD
jgi:hypothetical protein